VVYITDPNIEIEQSRNRTLSKLWVLCGVFVTQPTRLKIST